jgi:hypothetical protein
MSDVGAHVFGLRAKGTQLSYQCFSDFIASAGDNDPGTFASESKSGSTANAGKGAGNQDN